ncbi:MAG: hypothetical protein SH818_03930, partial [Saprospiraceae bacterium]|nr:hypothetical protein [Saprospiraceae bacterium]
MNFTSENSQHKRDDKDTTFSVQPQFEFEKFGIETTSPSETLSHIDGLISQGELAVENKGLFKVKTANKWIEEAKERPVPKMLFGEFWFEG